MVLGIGFRDSLHDLACLCNGGLSHRYRLKAPLQGRILLNIFAVFGKGGGADYLNLPPGQGRFQDIRSIHGTFCVTRPNQIMDFINYKNNISAFLDFPDQALHTAFELPTELCTGNQCCQIQQKYFFLPKLVGNLSGCDSLSQSFRNSSLAHTRFANQAGVILLSAVQDLDHTFRFHIPADHLIQLTLPGTAGQVHAITVQELVFLGFLFVPLFCLFFFFPRLGGLHRQISRVSKQLIQKRECGCLAVNFVIVMVFRMIPLSKNTAHLIAEQIQILVRNSHLLYRLINLGDPQTSGTFQTVSLIHCHAVLNFGNKYHCNVLTAFAAHLRLHISPSLSQGIYPSRCSIAHQKGKRKNKL